MTFWFRGAKMRLKQAWEGSWKLVKKAWQDLRHKFPFVSFCFLFYLTLTPAIVFHHLSRYLLFYWVGILLP